MILCIIKHSRAFRLPEKVRSISWNNLADVPFIPSSSAGWGYIGKKGSGDNHRIAINRAVGTLKSWSEGQREWRYTPEWHGHVHNLVRLKVQRYVMYGGKPSIT